MSSTLQWGILGSGTIAYTFAEALPASRTGALAAVASRSPDRAKQLGPKFGDARRYGSYEELLADKDVQAVYVACPHPDHAEWSIRAAAAGKHLLIEKPIAMNVAQTEAIIAAARQHDVFMMEGFMYRLHPLIARTVEMIREGAIGKVKMVEAAFGFEATYNPLSRLFNAALGGGGILDVGCYCTSLVRLLVGASLGTGLAEPIDLSAAGHIGRTGVDEYTTAILRFDGDVIAKCTTSVNLRIENGVRIYGDGGRMFLDAPFTAGKYDHPAEILYRPSGRYGQTQRIAVDDPDIFALEADTVAEHLAARQAPLPAPTWEDSLGNMKTLDRWRACLGLVYPCETTP